MADQAEGWVVDELLDAFEPAAVTAIHRNAKAASKPREREEEET